MAKSRTSFAPGNAASRGHGRPRLPQPTRNYIRDVRQAFREFTPDALKTLAEINGDDSAPPAARIAAANSILAYGWGQPKETVEKTNNLNITRTNRLEISHLSEGELDALESALRKTNMLMIEGNQGDSER
jgi:hypothetical protein